MINPLLDFLQKHRYVLFISLALLTVATLSLTLLPSDKIPADVRLFEFDKAGNSLTFGLWTFLLGLTRFVTSRKALPLLSIFIIGSLFGISVEIMQELLPVDRHADPYDIVADMIGCLVAVVLLKFITTHALPGRKAVEQTT